MQDEEDETEHQPEWLGVTVVLPSLKELQISRRGGIYGGLRPASNQCVSARRCALGRAGMGGGAFS
jgi:hypothetical protein